MPSKSDKIKQKLALLPDSPGVYLMLNASEKVIYVGKAKVLKNRVRSYFSGSVADNKTRELVSKIVDLDYFLTETEEQALVLEANLIKKYRPKYNILLKDDKQFPFIKITVTEDFPRLFVTRNLQKDGSKYFGHYIDSRAIRKTLRLMEWIFPMRTCSREIVEGKKLFQRACINFQMGKCPAPCLGKISKKDYLKVTKNAINFLNGRNQDVIDDLMLQMKEYSANLEFERAAKTRDNISDIQKLNNSRNLFFTDQKNRDVIGIYKEDNRSAVVVLKILVGKLLNKEIYNMDNVEGRDVNQIMAAFLQQYYSEKLDSLPSNILLQVEPTEFEILNNWLKNKLFVPQRGEKRSIIQIARDNAFNHVEEQKLKYLRKSNRTIFPIKELKDKLGLIKLPRKMICLDISTIQGTDTVSSLVFFENGKPKKKNYRHFIIKTVQGQDDFASLAETLKRYLLKIAEQEKPDLIVIDGGKGQLSSAYQILLEMKVEDIEMISLAKRLEEVFLPGRSESIILPRTSSALRMLINLRDEAHRFAITFHRKKRSKRTLQSELDRIEGIGDKMKFQLLKEFGSVENISNASVEDLIRVRGLGRKSAEKVLSQLH
ncbi:MAG: excinuclease ABC subunit UvrC [Candidatus Cloacimonadales bacterium]|nr:excinuclease ABC subunit UvrC [Candidatus Cloacimonadales bacterium]